MREQTVKDKIARRIDGHEKVENIAQSNDQVLAIHFTLRAWSLVGVVVATGQCSIDEHTGSGCLTNNEQNDHGDEHDRNACLLARRGVVGRRRRRRWCASGTGRVFTARHGSGVGRGITGRQIVVVGSGGS